MRNIVDVINQIKATIPEDDKLHSDLDKVVYDVSFTAPEVMILRWQSLQNHLSYRFKHEMKTPLARKVQLIFADEEK